MGTSVESVCCQERYEIVDDRFKGEKCITLNAEFQQICLNEVFLRVTPVGYNDVKNHNKNGKFNNKNYRFAAYKIFTWWIHNRLGKGIRRSLPSCAVWRIRDQFPDENNFYTGFEFKEDL